MVFGVLELNSPEGRQVSQGPPALPRAHSPLARTTFLPGGAGDFFQVIVTLGDDLTAESHKRRRMRASPKVTITQKMSPDPSLKNRSSKPRGWEWRAQTEPERPVFIEAECRSHHSI